MKKRRLTCVSAVCLLIALLVEHRHVAAQEPAAAGQERFVQAIGRVRESVLGQRNEFILRAPASRVAEIARLHRLRVIRRIENQDVYLVEGPGNFGTRYDRILDADIPALQQFVGTVQGDRDVQHFEANVAVVTPELASGINLNATTGAITTLLADRTIVDYFGAQAWRGYVTQPATTAIGLSASQEAGSTGAGIVAIIDTGVDPNHPLLQGVLVPGYDFIRDVAGSASEWSDVDGSLVSILDGSLVSILDGSLVSILDDAAVVVLNGSTVGILDQDTAAVLDPTQLPPAFGHGTMVAGIVHLVAPTARIMPLKAFRSDGTSTVFDVVQAIHYAVDNGARVINMSFSATAVSSEIAHAINYATSMGVVCIASAGNLGQEVLVYPAALRNVLSVGSTTSAAPPVRSSFSNYGASLVSLGAPGEGVITSYPGGNYAGVWGTSFSAPMAAGAAALLLQADPTVDQAKADILLGNADRIDAAMGKGRLNLDSTVRAVVDATPPTVGVTAPTDGGVLFGTVGIAASASDNVRIAGVLFLVDDQPLGPEDTAAPYEATWSTTASPNGSHAVKAVARDSRGNQSTSAITVTVSNDLSAPAVALTNPAHGTTVNGTLAVSATAADDHGVFGVQFKVDGVPLGTEDAAEPFEVPWNTLTASNGLHTLTAVARDAAGKETAASVVVTVANDATAPVVAMTSPAGGSVSGTVTIAVTATDDIGIAGVRFLIDGSNLGPEDTTAPYEATWVTSGVGNGVHTLTAVARDAAGRETTASTVVTVANDTTAPAIAITSPVSGAIVGGFVAVLAAASDDSGVAGVQFKLDGAPIGAEDTEAPYEVLWNAANSPHGAHTLTAVARDPAGNQATSASVLVTVADMSAPTVAVTNPTAGSVSGAVTIAATATDDVGVAGVQFLVNGVNLGAEDTTAPYELLWATLNVPNGVYTLEAVARDAAGNQAGSAGLVVTVANDTTAPTVMMTSPAAGTLSGTVTLSATATDAVGVAGVQFRLDGVNLGAEDTSAPYAVPWPTLSVANGAYTLTAIARDAAGNQASTASVVVTVFNDTTAPTITMTGPAAGSVAGTVTLAAMAADNVGVAGVQFLVDGMKLGLEDTAAPYAVLWPTLSVANGEHTLTAVVRDAAGNQATTASVVVTVANETTAPTVTLTGPVGGSVSGTVMIAATATDNVGVVGVQFLVDGVALGAEDASAPYEMPWPTLSVANGEHTLTAIARDAAGNQATAASVVVAVFNDTTAPTVTLTGPASGSVSGTVTVAAIGTDNVGVTGVQFLVGGVTLGAEDTTAPYEVPWPTLAMANGQHTLSAVARDAAGNQATSASVVVTVFNDTTAPTVTLTGPAGGNVSGTVMIAATATDDVGVVGVQFLVDGVALGAEDATAPYELTWPTLNVANGDHTLTAIARDAAGNQATATSVVVTVANDLTAPTITMTAPAAGSVSGTVTLAATATDAVGVVGVQFRLDGVNLGAEDTSAPYEVLWATVSVANGNHTLTAVARDAAGNQTTAASIVVTVANDTTVPTVTMTSPAAGSVSGTVTVAATATDASGVAGVQFRLDGVNLGAEVTMAPYELLWATLTVANGEHTLTAVARDAAGNQATAASIVVTVANDTTVPTVTMTSPAAGTVSGTVTVAATATDAVGVAGVQFRLDGVNLGAEDTAAPYELAWNTLTAVNGEHTLTAVARDAAGNQTTAASIVVTVANDTTAPTLTMTSPAPGSVSGSVMVSATAADDVGVAGVQFLLDGVSLDAEDTAAPYEVPWATLSAVNGEHTLTAVARDAAGNQTTANMVVTVANDTTAPTVTMTSPAPGSVSGSVMVSATAADDIGVAGVQFLLDGVNVGPEDTTAPYELAWNTLTAVNGEHTLTAVARDAVGNQTTAASIVMTVANDTTAPTMTMTSLAPGSVSGSVMVSATAADNVGVAGVQFRLDGVNLGAEDTTAPYELAWNTLTAVNGEHTLTAVARDAAGNQTTAASIVVTVANDTTAPTVTMTSPAPGSVSGSVMVSATAADDIGVAGVQFLLDGVSLDAEDTAAPYEVPWATLSAVNGEHTLIAVARDAAGNQTTAASLLVTVANETTAP